MQEVFYETADVITSPCTSEINNFKENTYFNFGHLMLASSQCTKLIMN